MARHKLTVIKRFPYRGDVTEEFSNSYVFIGTTPADAAAWRTLFNALVTQEKTVYPAFVEVIKGYGYASDAEDATAIWSVDLRVSPETVVPGTLSTAGTGGVPGDAAVWARWKLTRLNTKGKPIFLRKYFHGARSNGGDPADTIAAGQKTALTALATKLRDGSFLDGRIITAPGHDDVVLSVGASSYLTTRTLKRRGKRPGS